MAREEIVLQATDLRHIQVSCSSRRCSSSITYQIETLHGGFHQKCQVCNALYPKALIDAIDHFVRFVEYADRSAPALISLHVEL